MILNGLFIPMDFSPFWLFAHRSDKLRIEEIFIVLEFSRKATNFFRFFSLQRPQIFAKFFYALWSRTTDTQWRHKSKTSEKLGRCGRQNMLPPYLKIWEWEWIFGRAVKAISSLGVRSPWFCLTNLLNLVILSFFLDITSGLDEEEMLDAVEDAFWSK